MFGAAFFYDRLPPSSWDADLAEIKRLGFNTLDLYVPWNWHELADGDFDFEGRTNPRRNLRALLRLAKRDGFMLIVRPGPVIRNEWRNGGYPQWLLERPEYGMPLRDVLEGRYPATATLQNTHSDDAAAQWMENATHMRYATRWLQRALHEFDPVADRVLAVALDDDQGAYIDNQTWPAPHLQAYLEALRGTVASVTGGTVPAFVNTYQMKVTASSHVWAMGNWYQSDTYAIGEHDRSQLAFSTALLQTRPGQPVWTSEFQAGWLQQPQDVIPAAADPSNTILALGTMLQSGVTGVVDFPAQDSLAPAGYEAPFSNAYYAWDAAIPYYGAARPVGDRWAPTSEFGHMVATFGPALAQTHLAYDATIAWLGSAFDPASMTNADFGAIADRTIEAQHACREAGLTCRLVDLRFASDADLTRSRLLYLPRPSTGPLASRAFDPEIQRRLATLVRGGLFVASLVHDETMGGARLRTIARDAGVSPALANGGDATLSVTNGDSASGFVTVVNYARAVVHHAGLDVTLSPARHVALPAFDVPARSIAVLPIGLALRPFAAGFGVRDRIDWSTCPLSSMRLELPNRLGISPAASPCTTVATIGGRRETIAVDASQTVGLTPDGRAAEDGSPRISSAPAEFGNLLLSGGSFMTVCGKFLGLGPPADIPLDARTTIQTYGLIHATPKLGLGDACPGDMTKPFASATMVDLYEDGFPVAVLQNDLVRIVVSPHAGGRAFVFQDLSKPGTGFDTVGALRDDVAIQPPLSTTDRIAKYTHQFPAGFFNRPYDVSIERSGPQAVVRLRYRAPDAFPNGATFERTLALSPHSRDLVVDETATFDDGTPPEQHGVQITSLAVGDPRAPTTQRVLPDGTAFSVPLPAASLAMAEAHGAGLYDESTHQAVFAVSQGAVRRELQPSATPHTLVVTADIARAGTTRTIYELDFPPDLASARAELAALERDLPPAIAPLLPSR